MPWRIMKMLFFRIRMPSTGCSLKPNVAQEKNKSYDLPNSQVLSIWLTRNAASLWREDSKTCPILEDDSETPKLVFGPNPWFYHMKIAGMYGCSEPIRV